MRRSFLQLLGANRSGIPLGSVLHASDIGPMQTQQWVAELLHRSGVTVTPASTAPPFYDEDNNSVVQVISNTVEFEKTCELG